MAEIKFTFRGAMAPVFTPFNYDSSKSLNLEVIPDYANYLLKNGIKGVLVNGTTGEGMSMNVSQRKQVGAKWVEVCRETKQTLMLQVGGAPLPDVLELAQHADNMRVDAILCLPDLYFKPKTTEDLIKYISLVSAAAPNTPILYYHIPAFTGVHINMPEFLTKAEGCIKNLAGIKFTSVDLVEGAECIKVCRRKYAIFLGADQIMAGAYMLGFDSAIATSMNIFPAQVLNIQKYFTTDERSLTKSQTYQNQVTCLVHIIIKYGSWVASMKAAMEKVTKIKVGPVREPLEQISEENQIKMLFELSETL